MNFQMALLAIGSFCMATADFGTCRRTGVTGYAVIPQGCRVWNHWRGQWMRLMGGMYLLRQADETIRGKQLPLISLEQVTLLAIRHSTRNL